MQNNTENTELLTPEVKSIRKEFLTIKSLKSKLTTKEYANRLLDLVRRVDLELQSDFHNLTPNQNKQYQNLINNL